MSYAACVWFNAQTFKTQLIKITYPGPPVAQPLPVQNEQTETVEEQPVVNGRQWSEESKKGEPLPPKGMYQCLAKILGTCSSRFS